MKQPDSTHEVLNTLSPHQANVLRRRFGLAAELQNIASPANGSGPMPPPASSDGNSGGAPAAPLPPIPDIKSES